MIDPPNSSRFGPRLMEKSNNLTPGPGTQKVLEGTSPNGKYSVSIFKNSGAQVWSKDLRKSISTTSISPGPGSYSAPSDFGQYETPFMRTFSGSMYSSRSVSRNK